MDKLTRKQVAAICTGLLLLSTKMKKQEVDPWDLAETITGMWAFEPMTPREIDELRVALDSTPVGEGIVGEEV